ncbi:MAG: hypothetical protein DI535_01495 [Citrobacter freundii]|nr:MAG: hypothetical protein DI535_01495 [Citrobacter freundii]
MKPLLFLTAILLSCITIAQTSRKNTKESIDSLEKHLPVWMRDADIPGLQAVLIRDGKLAWTKSFGTANAETAVPVDDNTLFEAASLSKVITAYGALKLVDQGKLSLDTPLNVYLGNNYDIGDDPRIQMITARRVLTHSAGFPNWRPDEKGKLPVLFTPGERFSYSGEGFVYLSKVMEKLTGKDFETYIHDAVFVPLGMNNSYFSWQDTFAYRHVFRHDWLGKKSMRWEGKGYNAAASVHTTATDYGKFMIALMKGTGLKKKTWEEMFTPQIRVSSNTFPELYWGLGVGLEVEGKKKYFWHWGDQGDSKCFMKADLGKKDGFLYFTNSANGIAVADRIMDDALGGTTPSLAWLNYERFNPAAKTFFQMVVEKGAAAALKDYNEKKNSAAIQQIAEGTMNTIGYQLFRAEKLDDAILVFTQNTIDYPASGNTWDSLAEACAAKGDKESAIKYYEKAVQLDPSNTNAAEQIKKLKQ